MDATCFPGKRFGRLVAIEPRKRLHPNNSEMWLCQCDCGKAIMAPIDQLLSGTIYSCGCVISLEEPGNCIVKCPSCSKLFKTSFGNGKTAQFCPDCAPKYKGRNWRVCPICGKLYPDPPSIRNITCSKECASAWRAYTHKTVKNTWNEEAREKKREEGQTDNLKLGTLAAQKSPIAGRFETNQEAKVWVLVAPDGEEITVRNLRLWARKNTHLFDKPPGDRSAIQIAAGFQAIASTIRGVRKTPAMYYFGWTLKGPPKTPEK